MTIKKVKAWSVSRYLLFLDPKREYFSNAKKEIVLSDSRKYYSRPIIGNFRLNKMLQIIQALYYACHKTTLFNDKIKAYEHGGIVYFVYKNFRKLWEEEMTDNSKSLTKHHKEFIKKVYSYLKENYSDNELWELAHEDLAWQKARRRKLQGKEDTFVYDSEVLNYYEKLSGSMLTAMKIRH